MTRADKSTKIVGDGLRYKSKLAGSPFGCSQVMRTTTMSCLYCGKHRERSLLVMRKILGKSQLVCAPSCKALDEKIAQDKVASAAI